MSVATEVYNALGFAGGIILAVALLPQVVCVTVYQLQQTSLMYACAHARILTEQYI
jgi:hypothetical protein